MKYAICEKHGGSVVWITKYDNEYNTYDLTIDDIQGDITVCNVNESDLKFVTEDVHNKKVIEQALNVLGKEDAINYIEFFYSSKISKAKQLEYNKELRQALELNDRNILTKNFVDAVSDADKRLRRKEHNDLKNL